MVIPDKGHDPELMKKLHFRVQWALMLIMAGLILVHHQWILLQLKHYFHTH